MGKQYFKQVHFMFGVVTGGGDKNIVTLGKGGFVHTAKHLGIKALIGGGGYG